MSKDSIQIPAIFSGFSTRADGGASLRFATQELNDVDFSQLKKFHNSYGYVLFSPNEFKDEDVPTGNAETEGKSPSQRLRAVLFIYWKQKSAGGEFDSFYRKEMEKFINHVKEAID